MEQTLARATSQVSILDVGLGVRFRVDLSGLVSFALVVERIERQGGNGVAYLSRLANTASLSCFVFPIYIRRV